MKHLWHHVQTALRRKRKWHVHAISYTAERMLLPTIGVLYLPVKTVPVSERNPRGVRPGQAGLALRFWSFSVGFGFYFW